MLKVVNTWTCTNHWKMFDTFDITSYDNTVVTVEYAEIQIKYLDNFIFKHYHSS